MPRARTLVALALVFGGLLALRQPYAIGSPSFYCEDGSIFFKQQFEGGLRNALVTPYAGYHHLAARLLAAVAALAPLEQIPRVYALLALVLSTLPFVFFCSACFRHVIADDEWRIAIALVLTTLPNQDSLMRLAGVQFYLLLYCVLYCVAILPRAVGWRALLAALFVVGVWTSPVTIVCAPLLALRGVRASSRREKALWTFLLVNLVVMALGADRHALPAEPLTIGGQLRGLWHGFSFRVVGQTLLGMQLSRRVLEWGGFAPFSLLAATVLAIFVATWRHLRDRKIPIACGYLLVAAMGLILFRQQFLRDLVAPNGNATVAFHQRYFLLPTFAFALALVVGLPWRRPRAAWPLLVALLLIPDGEYCSWDWSSDAWPEAARQIELARARGGGTVHIASAVPEFDFDLQVR